MTAAAPATGPDLPGWALRMVWRDLCFMHWPVAPHLLAPGLPRGLELDTYGGQAWLGVVPFRMTGVAPRGLPTVPGLSDFAELNLRTYVTVGGVPGVWFYSLDADQALGVRLARGLFHLPYFDARLWASHERGVTRYAGLRTHRGQPPLRFAAAYRPEGEEFTAPQDSLEAFLTHRLFLYSADRQGRVYRGPITHRPWPLRRARAVIRENTLAAPLGLDLMGLGEPHLLHAERLDVRAGLIRRV